MSRILFDAFEDVVVGVSVTRSLPIPAGIASMTSSTQTSFVGVLGQQAALRGMAAEFAADARHSKVFPADLLLTKNQRVSSPLEFMLQQAGRKTLNTEYGINGLCVGIFPTEFLIAPIQKANSAIEYRIPIQVGCVQMVAVSTMASASKMSLAEILAQAGKSQTVPIDTLMQLTHKRIANTEILKSMDMQKRISVGIMEAISTARLLASDFSGTVSRANSSSAEFMKMCIALQSYAIEDAQGIQSGKRIDVEWLSAAIVIVGSRAIPISYDGVFIANRKFAQEWLGNLEKSSSAIIDYLKANQKTFHISGEYLERMIAAAGGCVEFMKGVGNEGAGSIDYCKAQQKSATIKSEWLNKASAIAGGSVEFTKDVGKEAKEAVDYRSGIQSGKRAQIELLGAMYARALLNAEAQAGRVRSTNIPLESLSGVKEDTALQIQILGVTAKDGALMIDYNVNSSITKSAVVGILRELYGGSIVSVEFRPKGIRVIIAATTEFAMQPTSGAADRIDHLSSTMEIIN